MSEPSPSVQSPEPNNITQALEAVIKHYNELAEPFKQHRVWTSIHEIRKEFCADEKVSMPLLAEMIVFEIHTVSLNREDRINAGLEKCLTQEVLEHWEMRARTVTNPLLKVTYADANWHFAPLIGTRAPVEMAQIVIDGCFEILKNKRYPDPIGARWYAQRAFDLAVRLNDPVRKPKAIETLIKTEDEISVDDKPGLWGFSFDCLLTGSKIQIDETTLTKLVQDIEARLERLTKPESYNLSASEKGLSRLVSYYKRIGHSEEAKKHISTYAKVVLLFANNDEASAFTRQHRLLELRELYLQNGMPDEAHGLEPKIHQLGASSLGEMQTTSVPYEISKEKMDEYVSSYICETLEESLTHIAARYLPPSRKDTEIEVREQAEKFPISYMFSQIILDSANGNEKPYHFGGQKVYHFQT